MPRHELKQQHDTNPAIHALGAANHSDQWDRGSTTTTPMTGLGTGASHTSAATSELVHVRVREYAIVVARYARSSLLTDGDLPHLPHHTSHHHLARRTHLHPMPSNTTNS